jgi:hypothetical protein
MERSRGGDKPRPRARTRSLSSFSPVASLVWSPTTQADTGEKKEVIICPFTVGWPREKETRKKTNASALQMRARPHINIHTHKEAPKGKGQRIRYRLLPHPPADHPDKK